MIPSLERPRRRCPTPGRIMENHWGREYCLAWYLAISALFCFTPWGSADAPTVKVFMHWEHWFPMTMDLVHREQIKRPHLSQFLSNGLFLVEIWISIRRAKTAANVNSPYSNGTPFERSPHNTRAFFSRSGVSTKTRFQSWAGSMRWSMTMRLAFREEMLV